MRWTLSRDNADDEFDRDVHVDEADIPTAQAVHALGRAAAELTQVSWRELEILLVAYSACDGGSTLRLSADRVEPGATAHRGGSPGY